MKKSLIALAVLAASGAAMAQSSVTLFGIVDATYAYGSGSVANKSQLTNSGYNSSRLGFRGVEDLGGGMSASFWLEAGVNNDNGSGGTTSTNNQGASGVTGGGGLTFNRRSTVSLNGGFGEVRLGRDYTPTFWNHTIYDPFGTNGVGSSVNTFSTLGSGTTTLVRANNSIGYFLYLTDMEVLEFTGNATGGSYNAGILGAAPAPYVATWLAERFGFVGDSEQARAYYAALPAEQQRVFARNLYFAELKAAGREYNTDGSVRQGSYLRGRAAIAALFPTSDVAGNSIRYDGDITLYGGAGVKTLFGGDIEMPGGELPELRRQCVLLDQRPGPGIGQNE